MRTVRLRDYVITVELRVFGRIEYRDLRVRAQNLAEAKADVRRAGYHSIRSWGRAEPEVVA